MSGYPRIKAEPGTVFGRLTVIREIERSKSGHRQVYCRCSCGNYVTRLLAGVNNGRSQSCGCIAKEIRQPKKEASYQRMRARKVARGLGHLYPE